MRHKENTTDKTANNAADKPQKTTSTARQASESSHRGEKKMN